MTVFLAPQVRDAVTGELSAELVGTTVQIVYVGTSTPVPITDYPDGAPVPGSRREVSTRFSLLSFSTPGGVYEVEAITEEGTRTYLISGEGLVTDAKEARQAAESAQQAAEDAVGGVGLPTDAAVAVLLPDSESLSGQALRSVTSQATRRLRPVALGSARAGASREYPTLSRPTTTRLLSKNDAGQPLGSIYWPWLVDRWQGNPGVATAERYALLYSTDHDDVGGVAWAVAPHPVGPWTLRGLLYVDTAVGYSTETPSIVWDEVTAKWLMFYQQTNAGKGSQSTVLATSPDLTTWTRYGVVLEEESALGVAGYSQMFPGSGHFGYFRPFRWAGSWYGYSLASGSDGVMTISYSDDGYTWERDARMLPLGSDLVRRLPGYNEANGWRVRWIGASVFAWNGSPWVIVTASGSAAAGAVVTTTIITAPLTPDLRSLAAVPITIEPPNVAGLAGEGLNASLTTDDGRMYGVQRAGGPNGAFLALEVV